MEVPKFLTPLILNGALMVKLLNNIYLLLNKPCCLPYYNYLSSLIYYLLLFSANLWRSYKVCNQMEP
jgi:hypothetical protein